MPQPTPTDKILLAPEYIFSLWKPSNTISWAIKGILYFIVVISWLLLMITPAVCIEAGRIILSSWKNFKKEKKY